ncbi:MAG: class II glutamine amidotransferase, partial [Planctomycetaceae bacterium]
MCGIVGYIGHRQAPEFLIEGLHRLEYRGYDSAGIAIHTDGEIEIRKKAGLVGELVKLVENRPVEGTLGIGHTRWATHGETTDVNSHPHAGGNGEVVLVHNGVIENYVKLRGRLQERGYVFRTGTDTEAVAHLIAQQLEESVKLGDDPTKTKTCIRAVEAAVRQLKGTYGLAILFRDCPGLLVAARAGSPLVVGIGKGEHFVASDASPLVGYTDQAVY